MKSELQNIRSQLVDDPFDSNLRLKYADLLKASAMWEEGQIQYSLLVKQGIESASVYSGKAICLLNLKENEAALEHYHAARKYDDFESIAELESLTAVASRSTPDLEVIQGQNNPPNLIELFPEDNDRTSFDDIAGMEALKKLLRINIVEPFLRPGLFAKFKKKAGGGILLYGPPGCGKTMVARAIASECNATFISVGISDVLNMWIGESEKNLAVIFEKARSLKPSVLFFDELDALAYSRSKSQNHNSRTLVNEFLSQLDGIDSQNDGVLILAASNMPWDIDPAMKRPGRFSRQVFIPPPDEAAQVKMLELKLKDVPCDDISFSQVVKRLPRYSGADIDGIIEMAKDSVLTDIFDSGLERNLNKMDIVEAINRFRPSTMDWLHTAKNIVKYAGGDNSYRDVEIYLKKAKLI
jgi:SpoVK/Ycf46/Vps4 family AAA+-type ATPase